MTPPKLQPALLGGLAIGVLSALPIINVANCCCAWILFGGGLAAYLMQQNYPARIGVGDGAIVGLLAGLIGAAVWAIISIPVNLVVGPFQAEMMKRALENAGDLPPEMRAFMEGLQGSAVMGATWILGFFFMLCVSAIFGMLGGLFGALIFGKDVPPPAPPAAGPPYTPPTFTPPPLPGSETPGPST
jgi:hypothetical protein